MEDDIIGSLTFGPRSIQGKYRLQAICAALQDPSKLENLLNYLSQDSRLTNVTDKILAFRTEEEEGYDDGSTFAAGEKLLHMLERMNVDNIVVMVFLWDYAYVGKSGTHLFKIILDEARKLLLSIHSKVFYMKQNKEPNQKAVTTKFFSFDNLPDPKRGAEENRKNKRPMHFLNDLGENKKVELEELQVDEAEVYAALNQVENSLRTLSQTDIINLRGATNNSLVLKVLQIVCILKGYAAATWPNIKEMLDSRTFKIELSMIDVNKISKSQIKRVRQIMVESPRLTVENLGKVSIAAATILSWAEGLIIWHAGKHLLKDAQVFSPDKIEDIVDMSGENSNSKCESKPQTGVKSEDEEVEDLKGEKSQEEDSQQDPELAEKLKKARQMRLECEERIEKILNNRLEEYNFEEGKADISDEDIEKYLAAENIQDQPTSVLTALVDKLKQRRSE